MGPAHRHKSASGLVSAAKKRLKRLGYAMTRFTSRSAPAIKSVSAVIMILTVICSILCLGALVIRTGYDHSPAEYRHLHLIIRFTQGMFLCNVIFNLIFNFRNTVKETRTVKWIVDAAILLTLLPWLYPHPSAPWIPWLEAILYSNIFLYSVLAAYSVVTLSFSVFRIIGRRTNPSLLMSGSFLIFIIIGTFMLMLPKSTYNGISFVDSLFVSTSAVSITGLTSVDVPTTFTTLGTVILASLIQIGALGVMTFTSFFALFFSGNASIYSQLMLKDMVYSKSMSSLIPTLLYILGFTIAIEIFGALLIFLSIHGSLGMTTGEEIAFAAFHSISAFCNAGFSTLPDGLSNPMLLHGNMAVYWAMSLIIISGSIGFPILVNFREAIAISFRRLRHKLIGTYMPDSMRQVHIYNMNTKIVLTTFSLLFVAGAILFFILEYNNSLAGMTFMEKITQSVFNSATPRSAGFSSVNPAGFLNVTLVIILFLMWVGGASQSTGGGIKVNTLAAIWLNLRAIVTGHDKVTAFHRTISVGSIRRANAVVALSIFSYMIVSLLLLAFEPDLPVRALLFESCSALFTVGSSLGITSQLSEASEIVLCIAMFLGRVGLISLLTGLLQRRSVAGVSYPSDNIIIN